MFFVEVMVGFRELGVWVEVIFVEVGGGGVGILIFCGFCGRGFNFLWIWFFGGSVIGSFNFFGVGFYVLDLFLLFCLLIFLLGCFVWRFEVYFCLLCIVFVVVFFWIC